MQLHVPQGIFCFFLSKSIVILQRHHSNKKQHYINNEAYIKKKNYNKEERKIIINMAVDKYAWVFKAYTNNNPQREK